MPLFKKASPRRSRVRKDMTAERLGRVANFATMDIVLSGFVLLLFAAFTVAVLSFEAMQRAQYISLIPTAVVVSLICLAGGLYIHRYQRRIVTNRTRALALAGLFAVMLTITKIGALLSRYPVLATGTAVATAIILAIAYDQRFAIGMSLFYCILAYLASGQTASMNLFLIMASGSFVCCFSLGEVRTWTKLLEVGAVAALVVLIMASALGILSERSVTFGLFLPAGLHAGVTVLVGIVAQGLLPLIEKACRVATSMTLVNYTFASQPLLKRLATEAPGTYSHSLQVSSIAEAAAEAIGRNGLLCRVGALYHDIGKVNKPDYFVENEFGSASRHKELSPAMSQLVIVGHVKDGIEMAREYKLPVVLRQFIGTHHGTTLVEYFYNEAKKQHGRKGSSACQAPSENEYCYPGPKPRAKEAAIVMLADAVESATRTLTEPTPAKIETLVHNIAMKRLQDGQFDESDLTLRELSQIEAAMVKSLAAQYHGRIAYPKAPEITEQTKADEGRTT